MWPLSAPRLLFVLRCGLLTVKAFPLKMPLEAALFQSGAPGCELFYRVRHASSARWRGGLSWSSPPPAQPAPASAQRQIALFKLRYGEQDRRLPLEKLKNKANAEQHNYRI